MDSSKTLPGSEECSSSESGWTTYIASPDDERDYAENEDDDEDGSISKQGYKKDAKEEPGDDADSDDSMASDASSGPSGQGPLYRKSRGFSHAEDRKYVGKKNNQQEEKKKKKHHEQIKGEKDKSAHSSGKLKKF